MLAVYECVLSFLQVDINFKLLKLGNYKGINKWDLFLPKIVEYLDKPYKDELSTNLLRFIKSPEADKSM